MTNKLEMTDAEIMAEMRSDSVLNQARRMFSAHAARIEQASFQSVPISPIEARRMEFEAVIEIADILDTKRRKTHSNAAKLGKNGGLARAENLSPERRKEIAELAAKARWGNK